jgi:DNA-binding CsgD family transcriptional regulator
VAAAVTVTAAEIAAEAQWMRDQAEADRLADELGCEVTLHLRFAAVFEACDLAPGVWLVSGTPDEIRAEWRAAWMREWLPFLGKLERARRRLLTLREREVAAVVAEGLTDRQVAWRLAISERTVHAHLRSAYAKTGTGSRTRLLAWLADRDADAVLNGAARAAALR